MQVDLGALGTFSRVGDDGAGKAARALETMADVQAFSHLTRTALVETAAVPGFLGDAETRIEVPFDGALSGRAFVSFDETFAAHATDRLPVGGDPIPEISNILTSGFVDVWAEDAPDTIDIRMPERVTDDDLVPDAAVVDDCAFVFESHVGVEAVEGTCRIAVVPDVEPFLAYLPTSGENPLSLEDLVAYSRLTQENAAGVADHIEGMTGFETDVVESHVDFMPVERVPALLDDAPYDGAVFECEGRIDSVIAVLFEEIEPGSVADAMLPSGDADAKVAESAVAELGNVTASGFLDGWANALDSTIDVSTPSHVRANGRAVLSTIAAGYGQHADCVAVFDTTVSAGEQFLCRVVALPSPTEVDAFADVAARLSGDTS
ncbi:chemotaxis protein CheC [Halobacterium zhouii]|uniref:chemotaxis protein CheC n=1 Tax=Halobacterium zhouii TaxID=2902624 RepID=UPI001E4098FE|nr:chemotaxis protein CheC [Halobacterium zhouii]